MLDVWTPCQYTSNNALYLTDTPMKDLVRDSFIGQQINHFSGGRLLSYADQRPDYAILQRYLSGGQSSYAKVSISSNLLSLNIILTDHKGIIGNSYTQ